MSLPNAFKEWTSLISTLRTCNDISNVKILINNLKSYSELMSESINIDEVNNVYLDEVYLILKTISNSIGRDSNPFSFSNDVSRTKTDPSSLQIYSKEMMIPLLEYAGAIWSTSAINFEYFKRMHMFSFFTSLVQNQNNLDIIIEISSPKNYTNIAYYIIKLLWENENDSEEIKSLLIFIIKRYESLKEMGVNKEATKDQVKIVLENTMNEMLFIIQIFQLFFEREKSIPSETYKQIIGSVFSYIDYLSNTQIRNWLIENWNQSYQGIIQRYLDSVLDIISIYNMNIVNHNFKSFPPLSSKLVKNVFTIIFCFISCLGEKEYLLDLLKYIIDKSLSFKVLEGMNNHANKTNYTTNIKCDRLMKSDFSVYYINKYIISIANASEGDNTTISNFALQNSLIWGYTLSSWGKINKYICEFITFLEFLCKWNENNCKLLIRNDIVKRIIKVAEWYYKDTNNELYIALEKLLMALIKYLRQYDLEIIFEYIVLKINTWEINDNVYQFFYSWWYTITQGLSTENHSNNIILTYYNIRQPNIYNCIYTSGVNFSKFRSNIVNKLSLYESEDSTNFSVYNIGSKYFSILQNFVFSTTKSTSFVLLRFEKEGKENIWMANKKPSYLEISIQGSKIWIKEDNVIIASSASELDDAVLPHGKDVQFLYEYNKESYLFVIYIDSKQVLNCPIHFFANWHQSFTMITGYLSDTIKELFDDKFTNFPIVKLSYMWIYNDKINYQLIDMIKLCQITSSKLGTIRTDQVLLQNLNKLNYQRICLDTNSCSDNKISQLQITEDEIHSKVIYEWVVDKIELIKTKKYLNQISTSLAHTIQKKIGIDFLDKQYIEYIPKTNNSDITFSADLNTNWISTYNPMETLCTNSILPRFNVKTFIKNKLIFKDFSIDYEMNNFRILKFWILFMNDWDNIEDFGKHGELFLISLKWYCSFLNINLKQLEKLCNNYEYMNSLIFVLVKNKFYLTKKVIAIWFYLSFSYPNYWNTDMSELQVMAPLFHQIITQILLNNYVFEAWYTDSKEEVLGLIRNKIWLYDFTGECTQLKIKILERYCEIFIFIDNQTSIDNLIVDDIWWISEQWLKPKVGLSQPKEKDISKIITLWGTVLALWNNFDKDVELHVHRVNKGNPELTKEIISHYFRKVYQGGFMSYKDKIISKICSMELNLWIKSQLLKQANLQSDFNPRNTTETRQLTVKSGIHKLLNSNTINKNKFRKASMNSNNSNEGNNNSSDNEQNKNANEVFRKGSISTTYHRSRRLNEDDVKNNTTSNQNKDKWYHVNSNRDHNIIIDFSGEEEQICIGNCYWCKAIKQNLVNKFHVHQGFNSFKRLITEIYKDLILIGNITKIQKLWTKKQYNVEIPLFHAFSYFLSEEEGPSRIRRKLIFKPDLILNKEIDRSNPWNVNSNTQNIQKENETTIFQKRFSFFPSSSSLNEVFAIDQIFGLSLVQSIIRKSDCYEFSYNCLWFKGMTYVNSVWIITNNTIYILTNMNIDMEGTWYKAITPFKRAYWVMKSDCDLIKEQCAYLNTYTKSSFDSSIFDRYNSDIEMICFNYLEISEWYKRKFLHQNNAVEIFLNNGKSMYISFNIDNRDKIVTQIINNITNAYEKRKNTLFKKSKANDLDSLGAQAGNADIQIQNHSNISSKSMIFLRDKNLFYKKHSHTIHNQYQCTKMQKKKECAILDIKQMIEECQAEWSEGNISNYDYIMILNTISGRTYNDWAQYPVFPWILQDYKSEYVDWINENTYRIWSYPIYAQNEETRETLKLKYESVEGGEGKYHSGSHYSNPGFVAYYMIRVKPFSLIAAEIQGGCFDTPDRLFFDIKAWYGVNDKYQELIPEMFSIPEIFENTSNWLFGNTQSGVNVNNVILPKWSFNNPRIFSKMIKKAMESPIVSNKINEWIDWIFGYRQKGSEAVEYFNIFRDVCSSFEPKKYIESNESKLDWDSKYEDIEMKIHEICNMGQNPNVLFSKSHPKRGKHHKVVAFFSKSNYLLNFKPRDRDYKIKLETKPNEISAYYELKCELWSHGQGGWSAFKQCSQSNDSSNKDYNPIYFIVGQCKTLLAPTYKNYLDWSKTKYSFLLVKPYDQISFEYNTYRESPISTIKPTCDGKYIIIGFEDGFIAKYKIKKIKDSVLHPEKGENKTKKSWWSKIFKKDKEKKANEGISNVESSPNILKHSVKIDTKKTMSTANIINIDTLLHKTNKFIQFIPYINYYSAQYEYKDYFIHCASSGEIKNFSKAHKENKNKKVLNTYILLINSSNLINNKIAWIDLCEPYSLIIVVDEFNYIYWFNLNSFTLNKVIAYNKWIKTTKKIKSLSICIYTGDFVAATSNEVALFNINGVLLTKLAHNNNDTTYNYTKIKHCLITSLKYTESDINWFTAHEDGNISIWKVDINMNKNLASSWNINKTINSYKMNYDSTYYNNNVKKDFELDLKFDLLIRIKCSEKPISLIKLSEDWTKVICVTNDNTIIYLSYEEFIEKKQKEKQKKVCLQCLSTIWSSKILCHSCHKKLCSKCKIESIIPEYSWRACKPICEDCAALITSKNIMLYDF